MRYRLNLDPAETAREAANWCMDRYEGRSAKNPTQQSYLGAAQRIIEVAERLGARTSEQRARMGLIKSKRK